MCYLQGSTQLYSSDIRHYIRPEVRSVKQQLQYLPLLSIPTTCS